MKKVFKIDVKSMTTKEALKLVRELMQSLSKDINPRWIIEYERKELLKKRKEKLTKLYANFR